MKAPDAEVMDDSIFALPMFQEMGDQIHVTTKAVKQLHWYSLPSQ